ncbi:hypothetical protein YA0871_02005 [Pseudomonas paralactis]|uniref:Uncharacterized protein n=2 Tax=Pseudomonas paralactis TaxID=1615673 RepID=A0ABS0UUT8_9PSED|nr:hypothetical protein [Pseudomonas paralactis]
MFAATENSTHRASPQSVVAPNALAAQTDIGAETSTQLPGHLPPVLTYAPDGIPLPASAGISPARLEYPRLMQQFKISHQEAFVTQHALQSRDMQRLHGEQPSFQDFVREQVDQMFAHGSPLRPKDLIFKRWVRQDDGSIKTLSSETVLEALKGKVVNLLVNPGQQPVVDDGEQSGIFTLATDAGPGTLVTPQLTLDTIAQRIVTQFPAALQTFWTTPRPTLRDPQVLQAPQDQLLTLHKQQLSTLAALRVSDGTLSAASKRLIDAALQYPTLAQREAAFPNGARPGVYPLTVDDGTERGALMAGCFLITSTDGSEATPPVWAKGRTLALDEANGPVVLYTPGEGFEQFATPALARQAIAERLDGAGTDAELLLQTLPLSLQNKSEPPSGNDVMLSADPLTGDVLAEAIPWMLKRQQEEVVANLALASTQPRLTKRMDEAADWSYLLSGDNAMAARDEQLADKLAPEWLKNLSPAQEGVFDYLEHSEARSANALASSLATLPSLGAFSRDRMNEAIERQFPAAQVDADKLMVRVKTRSNPHTGGQSSSHTLSIKHDRVSLTDLALKNPSEFPAVQYGHFTQLTFELPLTDTHGNPLLGDDGKQVVLNTEQLKALVNTADVGGSYTRKLKQALTTDASSGAAGEVRKAWKTHLSDMLDKEAFLAALNPNTYTIDATQDTSTKRGAQWVAAVLDYPDSADRPLVDGKKIVTNALIQRGLPVQGAMVIGNDTDASLVLCTPNAPDGVCFREVADMNALNALMEKKEWRLYTASRTSPVDKNDVVKAGQAIKESAFDTTKNPLRMLDALIKVLKLTSAPVTLKPFDGNFQEELYQQKVKLLIDHADHQSVSSAEVAYQSRINKVQFGVEVASIFLDLLPVLGKGISMGVRLGKAGVTALRANARVLPRLLKSPGAMRAVYSDFTMAASGIPNVSAVPLRPVFKKPVVPPVPPVIVRAPTAGTRPNVSLSAFSVSEDVIKGRPLRPDGTYNVGNDFYVRFTDSTGVNKVYQIDSAFHARDGRVAIVDPQAPLTTSKLYRVQAFLESAGNGEWRLSRLPGGAPTATGSSRPSKRPLDQGSSSGRVDMTSGAGGPSANKRPRVPESFPGEKALMEPPVKGENVFYHYTSGKPHAAIMADRSLSPSSSDLIGNRLPGTRGRHYFTDLAPGDMPTQKISETIFGKRKYGNAMDKMSHYYEINTSGLNVIQSPDNPHIFYVDVPFQIPLQYRGGPNAELVDRVISHGKTPILK